MSESVWSAVI